MSQQVRVWYMPQRQVKKGLGESAQLSLTYQSLCCLHTQSMDIDKGADD